MLYKTKFNVISATLFLFLFFVLFLGYYYDIVYRTKKEKLKKLTEQDKKDAEKLKKYASIGALLGIFIMKLFTPGDSFLALVMLLLSYGLMFFVPRVLILTYLKIKFPEKYLLSNRMDIEN